jgi:hypothetical protein
MALYNVNIPNQMKNNRLLKILVVFSVLICQVVPWSSTSAADNAILPSFTDFVASVTNGQAGVVRGVYVPGVLALRVLQQPAGDPASVLQLDGVATQFSVAAQFHVTGLLAHNNLAGITFSRLRIGQEVRLVYGDSRVEYYMVNRLARFQALQPDIRDGHYLDLKSNITFTTQDIFSEFYNGNVHVTFQTCILQDGNSSWGRLFVTAIPILTMNPLFQTLKIQLLSDFNKLMLFLPH